MLWKMSKSKLGCYSLHYSTNVTGFGEKHLTAWIRLLVQNVALGLFKYGNMSRTIIYLVVIDIGVL